MCMVFDMNGAGLSNMDMDLVRFIMNCFKTYYPNLLEWMLIFNMPWVLQGRKLTGLSSIVCFCFVSH